MTDDLKFGIQQTARDLIKLYAAMDELKHIPMKPPEVRTMQNTGGNPSMPGTWLWMHRSVDLEQLLRQVVFNAFADIQVKLKDKDGAISNLLERVDENADLIAQLPWADDFYEHLHDQARQIGRWVSPTASTQKVREALKKVQRRYTAADAAALASAATGQAIDRKQVTYWGRSGRITLRLGIDGISTYDLNEVFEVASSYKDNRRKSG